MLLSRAALLLLLLPLTAAAQRETTQESLARLEESLQLRLEDSGFDPSQLLPAIVVSVNPAYEETRTWYPTAALATLVQVFGGAGLRSCEACMAPRLFVEDGRLEQLTSGLMATEIIRLDEASRGSSPPARTAIWLDENPGGVSLRIVELQNSRVVLAENFDPTLKEAARTRRAFSQARALERRARGDSIVHTFVDLTMYPGQHLSLEWSEQWGDTHENLSGLAISIFDPVLGVGLSYARILPNALNLTVGAKVFLSIPTALVGVITGTPTAILDPLVTGMVIVRWPIFNTNYAVIASASTNGRIGIGLSMMNFTLLPVVP